MEFLEAIENVAENVLFEQWDQSVAWISTL